jgi:DNA adenine methylase
MDEWKKQKSLLNGKTYNAQINDLDIAFATLYLNRCNRSGILSSGPIGGQEQSGQWKIDARFRKEDLINRIKIISKYKEHIKIYNYDAIVFLKKYLKKTGIDLKKSLIYLDPPYFEKGYQLYRKYFHESDHLTLHNFLKDESRIRWILSYDDVKFISDLYKGKNSNGFSTNHFAYCTSSNGFGQIGSKTKRGFQDSYTPFLPFRQSTKNDFVSFVKASFFVYPSES